ncbi:MAG: hypothetical protein SGJ01_07465 [Gemmatimonadota bacterium]|mgnify:CR=1 FL=1|nr:hypothetical protein [Gemmatimonadota bacterium]
MGIGERREVLPGRYAVTFTGLQRPAGRTEIVQVTPYRSTYANCAVLCWTSLAASLRANVECCDAAGNFADSQFEMLVIA